MKTTQILAAAGIACAGVLAVAGPAMASPPHAVAGDFSLPGTDTAGSNGYCPFAVDVHYLTNQHPTPTKGGAGFGYATVTNTSTGKTISYVISGPGTYTNYADGAFSLDATGPNLLWTTVANSYPGVPQLNYTNGHVRVSVASSGLTTGFQLSGRSTDVCAALG